MAGGPRLPAWAISGAANHAPLPSRARRHGLRGHGPPHPPPRPEPHVGVPQARLPRREPRDGRVPAAALEAALPRGLRRGGHRAAALRGGRPDRRLRRVRLGCHRHRQLDQPALLREARHAAALRRGAGRRTPTTRAAASAASCSSSSQHLARVRGCTHLVLEVAENNEDALRWYRKRNFYKLDAAIFLARKIETEPELLPPRRIGDRARTLPAATVVPVSGAVAAPTAAAPRARSRRPAPRPGRR